MNRPFQRLMAIVCSAVLLCACALAEDGAAGQGKPDGASSRGNPPAQNGGTPPEKPDGVPDAPGNMGAPPDSQPGGMGGPGGFGGSGTVTQGTAATTLTESTTVSGGAFTSAGENENALRVMGDIDVSLSGVVVDKSGGDTSNTEDSDFYGQNAGLLAKDGANVTIKNASIDTDAAGGNAVFSYGPGTIVTISGSTIRTRMNNSGGIHVTGGGTLSAENLDVETYGNSAAAIRSDRGGGTLLADGGIYVTNVTGSPAVYSTANITVKNAELTANHSEAIVVEGKNSVELENCAVSGSMDGTYGGDSGENIHAVMIYQSMSGNADVGRSHFRMTGGSLTGLAGDLIYVTNTSCTIGLSGVSLTLANDNLLTVAGNPNCRGWGRAGENGGQCEMTADAQIMQGVITVDSISTLDLIMQNGTAYTGAINPDGQSGTVNVTLDGGSIWTLTADTFVTSFTGSLDSVVLNGFTLHVANAE